VTDPSPDQAAAFLAGIQQSAEAIAAALVHVEQAAGAAASAQAAEIMIRLALFTFSIVSDHSWRKPCS
jgi:hypothetical protein